MATYTREMLEATSIFAVRDIAKEVGVSSPTKKNKGELIDLILKITSGEMAPPEAPRRGRPKKQTLIPETPQTAGNETAPEPRPAKEETRVFDQPKARESRSVREFGGSRGQHRQQAFRDEKRRDEAPADQLREGFLEINPDGYGFLRVRNCECNDMDAYVPAIKIKQFALRRGDRVRAYCKTLQEGKPAAGKSQYGATAPAGKPASSRVKGRSVENGGKAPSRGAARGSAAARRRHEIFGGSLSRRPGRGTVTMTEITITFTLTLTVTVTITQPYLHGNVQQNPRSRLQ